jgi:predicted trehalose synthase
MVVDESLCLFHNDVDKKVYEIEYEVTYITKWQVIAEDENEAMNKMVTRT